MLSDEDYESLYSLAEYAMRSDANLSWRKALSNAAYALGAERARVVKPLVWRAVVENEWFKTTDRHYEVFAQQGGSGDFYARDIWRGDTVIDGGSLDEAKAACQKHHEQFVLSMLEPV